MTTCLGQTDAATSQRRDPPMESSFYSVSQAAAVLGVSRVTLSRWIRAGFLPVARLGHRTVRISHADLDQFVGAHGLGTTRPWAGRQRSAPTHAATGHTDGG